jgi:penicillin-binding protein 1A
MAAGAQTLANGGLHFEPFFVERIEGPSGVIYQHQSAGTQVLTPDVAARTTSILEGVLVSGTARRSALEGRVAAGKTGTQDNNTNAWFVGFTPELTTAVWVGHPDKYLPMNDIPEFSAVGVPRVQGGTFPAAIWKATMDAALLGVPASGFPAPPDNSRSPMRLVLPGVDCPVPTTLPMAEPVDTSSPVVVVEPTTTTRPPRTTTTTLPEASSITTVPRGVVDPTWPVPTIDPEDFTVERCATAPTAPPTIG